MIPEYERAVHFRLGRLKGAKGPGLIIVWPIIDRIIRVSLRTVALEIPTQELITSDNVTVRVNGVTYYTVRDPIKAVLTVRDFHFATAQKSQVTLLAVLREHDLDSLLRDRASISGLLRGLIDEATEPWGIEVTTAEIKDVELPESMRRAIASNTRMISNGSGNTMVEFRSTEISANVASVRSCSAAGCSSSTDAA